MCKSEGIKKTQNKPMETTNCINWSMCFEQETRFKVKQFFNTKEHSGITHQYCR